MDFKLFNKKTTPVALSDVSYKTTCKSKTINIIFQDTRFKQFKKVGKKGLL